MRDVVGTLILIRGLPRSGKTTLAKLLAPQAHYAADDWFERNGSYEFNRNESPIAHAECQRAVAKAMAASIDVIAVHNTFVESWEAEPYFRLAALHSYAVTVIECQNAFGENGHNVPTEIVLDMSRRWHRTLKPPHDVVRVESAYRMHSKATQGTPEPPDKVEIGPGVTASPLDLEGKK